MIRVHQVRMSRKWGLFFCILDARGGFHTTNVGVELSRVEMSGVEMSTFGIKIGHLNPRLCNRIYCVIPGVEMSPIPHVYSSNYSRARKSFGHLNARRCDFNIDIIIPTRKPPLSVSN